MGFFEKLKIGLGKTRESISEKVNSVFSVFTKIDEEFFEELEEVLIMADIGVNTTEAIIADLKEKVKEKHITKTEDCRQVLIDSIKEEQYLFVYYPDPEWLEGSAFLACDRDDRQLAMR